MPWRRFLDTDALSLVTDGNQGVEREFVALFMQTVESCVARLEHLVTNDIDGDWPKIVHELKGAALNIHANAMVTICKECEFLPPEVSVRRIAWKRFKDECDRYQALLALSAPPQ